MSGRTISAPTAEMFLWNAGGGVPYKSASERKQIMLNVQGKRVYERLVECAAVRSAVAAARSAAAAVRSTAKGYFKVDGVLL